MPDTHTIQQVNACNECNTIALLRAGVLQQSRTQMQTHFTNCCGPWVAHVHIARTGACYLGYAPSLPLLRGSSCRLRGCLALVRRMLSRVQLLLKPGDCGVQLCLATRLRLLGFGVRLRAVWKGVKVRSGQDSEVTNVDSARNCQKRGSRLPN